jgi:hypothetical protein
MIVSCGDFIDPQSHMTARTAELIVLRSEIIATEMRRIATVSPIDQPFSTADYDAVIRRPADPRRLATQLARVR